jgi:hypothetical protein
MPKSCLLVVILLLLPLAAWGKKGETLEQLKEQANSARGGDRVKLCLEIAQRQLSRANQLYTEGKVGDARAALNDMAAYSELASTAAIESGKRTKHAEISVRQMSRKLSDLKRTLNFEDQQPVQDAIDRMETVRTQLLTKMFGGKKQ